MSKDRSRVTVLEGDALEDALLRTKYVRCDIHESDHILDSLLARLRGVPRGGKLVVVSITLLDKDHTILGRMRQDGMYFHGFGTPGSPRRELCATENGPHRSVGLLLNENDDDFSDFVSAALAADALGMPPGDCRTMAEVIRALRARRRPRDVDGVAPSPNGRVADAARGARGPQSPDARRAPRRAVNDGHEHL